MHREKKESFIQVYFLAVLGFVYTSLFLFWFQMQK